MFTQIFNFLGVWKNKTKIDFKIGEKYHIFIKPRFAYRKEYNDESIITLTVKGVFDDGRISVSAVTGGLSIKTGMFVINPNKKSHLKSILVELGETNHPVHNINKLYVSKNASYKKPDGEFLARDDAKKFHKKNEKVIELQRLRDEIVNKLNSDFKSSIEAYNSSSDDCILDEKISSLKNELNKLNTN